MKTRQNIQPNRICSYDDLKFLCAIKPDAKAYERIKLLGLQPTFLKRQRMLAFAYLLGFMVGDAAKRSVGKTSGKMFIEYGLTKRYTENVRFGEFVALCINILGLKVKRIMDNVVNEKIPYGRYHWKSEHSVLVKWIFNTCLGLHDGQLTTYDSVNMRWILSAPKSFRIWFIQGIADSDGYVHLGDQQVHIITSPNTKLVEQILQSLKVPYRTGVAKRLDLVKINVVRAYNLPIFNRYVCSRRYKMTEKLAKATRVKRKWSESIRSKITDLARSGKTSYGILRSILDSDDIAIRACNVRKYVKKL